MNDVRYIAFDVFLIKLEEVITCYIGSDSCYKGENFSYLTWTKWISLETGPEQSSPKKP